VFWRVEGHTGLYLLFKTVCDNYELLPAENYKLPPEAEGLESVPEVKPVPTILKSGSVPIINTEHKADEEDPSFIGAGRTNTRRHIRSSPSTGSAVSTVLEADEDDSDVTQKLVDMHIAEDEADPKTGGHEPAKQETHMEAEAETEAVPEQTNNAKENAEPQAHSEAETDQPLVHPSEEESEKVEEPIEEEKLEENTGEEATIPVVIEGETPVTENDGEKSAKPESVE
jgi:hypothetical protein